MKIASSQVAISNDYHREEVNQRHVSMVKSAAQNPSAAQSASASTASAVQISKQQLTQSRMEATKTGKAEQPENDELQGHYDKSLMLMKMILERMTGKKIDLYDAHRFKQSLESVQGNEQGNVPQGPQGDVPAQQRSPDDLMVVANYHYEKESNQLQFGGTVQLADGRQTNFAMAVEFSQEYEELSLELTKREKLKDPLVVSFSTEPVKLSGDKFQFDVDGDQQKENIAMLEKGFGYLALDKNGDGIINDGTELFGGQSGNGFAELAQYDDNQDGYIDENDAVYKNLTVWVKNADQDQQVSLSDKGIGAIALDNVDSPYTIRDGEEKLGVIRKSGYYLNENGSAGLIQQLDYTV